MATDNIVDVAVAVVVDSRQQVLISFRHQSLHQGNLWEFPGGKCEVGESIEAALRRELMEELNLQVRKCFPLKIIRHDYVDKSVRLHVWRVTEFSGEVRAMEGQEMTWKPVSELHPADFPAANAAIIKLLKLPSLIAITPQLADLQALDVCIGQLLSRQLPIIQLRQAHLSAPEYLQWFRHANAICEAAGATLVFNGDIDDFAGSGGSAYHAKSSRLAGWTSRPVGASSLFSCSCHNLAELQHAAALDADFVSLSPVKATAKYPASCQLGWQQFAELAHSVSVPIYALGGLSHADITRARHAGAHGVCGIGMFQPTAAE